MDKVKIKRIAIICVVIMIIISGGIGIYQYNKVRLYNNLINEANNLKEDKSFYDEGIQLMNDKKYLEAIEQFSKISKEADKFYSEAENYIEECKKQYIAQNIQLSTDALKNNKYDDANKYLDDVLKIDANNTEAKELKNDIATKVATADKKISKVIVIDPGHGNRSNLEKEPQAPNSSIMKIKDGGGAQGVITRIPEYLITMKVSLKLKEILEMRGYTVKMTKTDNSQSLGNVERAEIWNRENADLAIRIHADSSENSSIKGASMLIPAPINENTRAIFNKSEEYGQIILDTVIKEVGMVNRGVVQRDDMTGFNWSKIPVVLIEMGFLSNDEEDRLLSSEEYQNKIALAMADGISKAVK
ncbi:MAG: N-acetylmuramoyl-L-alanine amidase [Clostridiaceae bacterium]